MMRRSIPILTGFFFVAYMTYAGPCPDQVSLMKNLRAKVDNKVISYKSQIARWLPYLDSLENCSTAEDSVIAYLNKKIGSFFNADNDNLNAIKYYSRFLDITRANLGKPNFHPEDMMTGFYYYSVMYHDLGMKKERMEALDSCIVYADKIKVNNRTNLFALYQNVEYYYDLGDYYRSIDYATRCETIARICQDSLSADIREVGFKYNSSSSAWKIKALLQLGNLDEAEEYINRKIEESKANKTKFNLETWYGLSAELNVKKRDYAKAITLLNLALKNAQQDVHDFSCKQILNTLGKDVYYNIYHDTQNALKCYRKALSFHNRNPSLELADQIESLNIYTNIAEIYVGQNQFDTAFFYFQKAFEQIMPGSSEDQVLNTPNPAFLRQKKVYYITNLMIAKGEACQKKYVWTGERRFLNDALHIYRVTDQFLDLLRKEQTELESKLFWRKDTRRLYEHAIDACFELKNETEAFYFFEKSRAVLLNDQLTHHRWVGDKDIRKEIQLAKYITQLQRSIDIADQSTAIYGELVKDKIDKARELDKIRRQIKADNPLYYHSLVDTMSISVSRARNFILPGFQALIEIFAGDSAVYILIITHKGNSLRKLDKQKYDRLAKEFSGFLSNPGVLNKYYGDFCITSNQLYSMIFGGMNIPPGRIIISPDGPGFPYEALVTTKSSQPIHYLVQDYSISYTFSAQFLESTESSVMKNSSRDFLGLAPIRFNSSFRLVALPGSDHSLDRINQLFHNTQMVTGKDATSKKFLDEFYQYQIVQLYTHASDSGKYREPVIYFGDSSVNLSDLVYEEKPFTKLMVLSACETASGKNYLGEGVFSFSRGFAALGIPSSISNLWSVENESTYRLTELFYKYLAEGLPLDVSLQKAKLEFLKTASREKQLPYFWAALILSGRSDPIPIRKPFPLPFILTGIVAGLFAISLGWKWYRRKKSTQAPGKV